ncbi:MAG: hypothetical protein JAY97_21080, partial [Candidatus Thiodiazotropha sp. 'RUGA']|nr:hypothetical protein [Candidatus Thiodiazotropha sp. 'RUGA']
GGRATWGQPGKLSDDRRSTGYRHCWSARLGMKTALVRTGRFAPDTDYPAELPRPDWDINSLSELSQILFCS